MPNEKEYQGEVFKTLSKFGWAIKLQNDVVVCTYCHKPIHLIHTGFADYHCDVIAKDGRPFPIKVEMKANYRRFELSQIAPEQINFLTEWHELTHGNAYVWLQLGEDKVNSKKTIYPRSAWLIPAPYFFYSMKTVQEKGGVKYIPMNTATANDGRIKDKTLTCNNLFYAYRLEWMGDKLWRPNKDHTIYINAKVQYDDFK